MAYAGEEGGDVFGVGADECCVGEDGLVACGVAGACALAEGFDGVEELWGWVDVGGDFVADFVDVCSASEVYGVPAWGLWGEEGVYGVVPVGECVGCAGVGVDECGDCVGGRALEASECL